MKIKIIIILFLTGIVLQGCIEENVIDTLTPVTVKLKWVHQAQFAGQYMAKEKGFYKDEGLNVTLTSFTFENPSLDSVIDGSALFGITGADELLLKIQEGHPLKAIAVIYQINPVCAYSLSESNITKPQDFIGKTIGIERASDGTDINVGILYYAMMAKQSINRSQVNEVTIGYDATELLAGETDISTGYIINEPHQAIEAGYAVNTILMADYGVNMYADVIFTRTDTIENNPELCVKFLRATLNGWQYAIEHEEETVNTVLQYAQDRSYAHEEYMLRNTIPLINDGITPIGWMEKEKWENVQTILLDYDIINQSIDIEKAYTTEFLETIYGEI